MVYTISDLWVTPTSFLKNRNPVLLGVTGWPAKYLFSQSPLQIGVTMGHILDQEDLSKGQLEAFKKAFIFLRIGDRYDWHCPSIFFSWAKMWCLELKQLSIDHEAKQNQQTNRQKTRKNTKKLALSSLNYRTNIDKPIHYLQVFIFMGKKWNPLLKSLVILTGILLVFWYFILAEIHEVLLIKHHGPKILGQCLRCQ